MNVMNHITKKHNTRCHKCKSIIYNMLQIIFENVEFKYKAEGVSVRLEDYSNCKDKEVYAQLEKVYRSLVEIHHYDDFVRTKHLNRCDLYIPSKKVIIELDELQHFTFPRLVSLENYPGKIKLGYDIDWYKSTCNQLRSVDNDPKYRDEQRAWYDTMRDFLPYLSNEVELTVRIPLGFHSWCDLSPNREEDVELFKQYILCLMK